MEGMQIHTYINDAIFICMVPTCKIALWVSFTTKQDVVKILLSKHDSSLLMQLSQSGQLYGAVSAHFCKWTVTGDVG